MEDHAISAFIDDQLDLSEKIRFVETVHAEKDFKDEVLCFLAMERELRAPVSGNPPQVTLKPDVLSRLRDWINPLGWFAGGLTAALLLAALVFRSAPATIAQRFIIYQPEARSAFLVGSFSQWRGVAMHPSGTSGYWEITVNLPPGEYRYSFLLDGGQVPDPTVPMQESDDFGGVNSIINLRI